MQLYSPNQREKKMLRSAQTYLISGGKMIFQEDKQYTPLSQSNLQVALLNQDRGEAIFLVMNFVFLEV